MKCLKTRSLIDLKRAFSGEITLLTEGAEVIKPATDGIVVGREEFKANAVTAQPHMLLCPESRFWCIGHCFVCRER